MGTAAVSSPHRGTAGHRPESRWLWLVKWILAIPHYIVLAFLWLTLFVLTIVAFFAILFTSRYPRGIFDFNVGVLRWTWRVAFYSYGALGTDRYPPFTLDDVPDYPARLEVAYPERLSRGLVLVKWWLLAIPQYIVTGIFLGGGSYAAAQVDDWFWGIGFETGLIGILVLFAGVALLFTTRYPGGLFDFAVGLDRWVARVAAYVLLMRDEYPPFRLDQGGADPATAFAGRPSRSRAPVPVAGEPAAPPARRGWTGGRIALVVVGTIAGLLALGLLVGGCALVAVDQTQRDDDGFLMSPTEDFSTPTYAIVSENADLGDEGPSGRSTRSSARSGFAARATARCSSGSARPATSRGTSEASSATWSTTSTATVTRSTRDVRAARRAGSRATRRSGSRRRRAPASGRSAGSRRTGTGGRS